VLHGNDRQAARDGRNISTAVLVYIGLLLSRRSFVLFGQEPSLLWTPARRPSGGPVRLPLGERRGIGWCVQCVRDVQERWVK